MTPALDVHPLKSRIGDFIAGLQDLEDHPITTSLVLDFLADTRLSPEALAPYIWWSSERYTRNLIYRDQRFEVLALCWMPGQHTPIHTHNGQLGWVTVVQGELECRDYRFIKPPAEPTLPAKNSAVAQAPPALSRRVEVELVARATCVADGTVSVVDHRQTTHQIANLERSRHGSVSLHVYSRPIDSCVLFDEKTRCWERRPLHYHSADGVLLGQAA